MRYTDIKMGQEFTSVIDEALTKAAYRGKRLASLLERAILHDHTCELFHSGEHTAKKIKGSAAAGNSEDAIAIRCRFTVSARGCRGEPPKGCFP